MSRKGARHDAVGATHVTADGGLAGGTRAWLGFSLAAGTVVVALGVVVLIGWLLDVPAMKSIRPTWVSMKANTALAFVLSGLVLTLVARGRRGTSRFRRLTLLLAAGVILLGGLTLIEYVTGLGLSIDELLFRDAEAAVATVDSGRMAPLTAVAFVLVGSALVLAAVGRRPRVAQALAFFAGLFGAVSLAGYALGGTSFGSPTGFTPMAAHTALAFVLLACGVLALDPAAGWMELLANAGRGTQAPAGEGRRGSPASSPPRFARRRMRAFFVGGSAMLALVVLLSIVSFQRLSYQSEMRTRHFAVHQRMDDTRAALLDVETCVLGYALSGSEEYQAQYERGRRSIVEDLATLRDVTSHDPAQEELLTTFAGLVRQRLAAAEQLVEARRAEGLSAAQRVVASGVGKRVTDDARQALARVCAREAALLVESEAATQYGTLLTVILTTAALALALALFLAAFVLYYREQHRRAALEVELTRARDEADAANRAKSDFLANTSHEVRTPMNAIIGMTDLVLETPLSADQKRFLGTVREAAASLLDLLNDLLDFAKIEAGQLDLEHTPFALREVVESTTRMMAERAHSKGLELACRLAPEVPDALVGDPGRLRQVLVNLIGNAIKFTARGEVVVRVEVEEEREHDVALRFSVTDTGIGIAPDKLKVIFDPFRQADQSVTRAYGGTGLGLAISAQLAARMEGRLWAESEVGKGSVFHFSARFEAAEEVREPLSARLEGLNGMRVLVVDNSAANRQIYGELITAWAMRPTLAEGGADALAAVEEALATGDPFALALLDARMPAMDGYQLAERLRGRPEFAGLAILMLSSGSDLGDAERRRELGIAACLAKPVRQSELLNGIMRAMGIANGEKGAAEESAPIVRPLRVLLAEDHPMNQELAARILTKRGHTVTVADNGREAVDRLCTDEFDVVLMDLQMPVMDGLAATAAIRDPRSPVRRHDVPIVAMTAHAMKGDRERCLAAGMDAYVPKPITAGALMDALADLLGAEPPRPALRQAGGPPERPPASAESADPSDLFDLAAVLGRMEGDQALAKKVARMFLADLPALLAGIEEAAEASDVEALALHAHTLKGSAATLGGRRAQEASLRLETAAREGDVPAARGMLDDVRREIDALEQAVREFVRAEGADGGKA